MKSSNPYQEETARPPNDMRIYVIALLALALSMSPGCRRMAQDYVARGDAFAAKSEADDAILEYRKALQKDPAFGVAYLRLGILYARKAKGREAFDALSRAVALMPDNREAHVRLADLCIALYFVDRNPQPVLAHTLGRMATELNHLQPSEYDTLRVGGIAAVMNNRPADAIPLLRRAISMRPAEPNAVLALVHALYENAQFQEAQTLGWELIRRDKSFLPVYDEMYSEAVGERDFPAALHIREEGVRNNPKSVEAVLALAWHFHNIGNVVARNRALDPLITDPATFPDGRLSAGQFLFDRGDLERARLFVFDGSRSHPGDLRYIRTLALIFNFQGNKGEAIQLLSDALLNHHDDVGIRALRASMLVESGTPENIAKARSEYEDLLKAAPNSADLLYGLGRALFHQGAYPQARDLFQKIVPLVSDAAAARLALGEVSLSLNDVGSAMRVANDILAQKPDSVPARLLHAKALVFSGQIKAGLSELKLLELDAPGTIDVIVELGRAELAARQFESAEAVFKRSYRPGISDLRIVQGLAMAEVGRGKGNEAISIWENEVKVSPEPLNARKNLAEVALVVRRPEVAIREYGVIINARPSDGEAYERLAWSFHLLGNLDKALEAARKACELQPSSIPNRLEVAVILSEKGDWLGAANEYRRALRSAPENPVIVNNLANALAEAGTSLDEAENLANSAVRALPAERQAKDTLALVYIKNNKADQAIRILRMLLKQEPKRASFRYHLALALAEKGLTTDAIKEFQEALRCKPAPSEEATIRAALKVL